MKAVDNITGVLQGQSEFFILLFFFVDDSFMKEILWPNFKKHQTIFFFFQWMMQISSEEAFTRKLSGALSIAPANKILLCTCHQMSLRYQPQAES